MSDWYRVKRQDLRKMKGVRGFFHHYSSLPQALQTIYPDYPWEPHRFTQAEGGYWANQANQREFLERVGKKLGVNQVPWVSFHNRLSLLTSSSQLALRLVQSEPKEADETERRWRRIVALPPVFAWSIEGGIPWVSLGGASVRRIGSFPRWLLVQYRQSTRISRTNREKSRHPTGLPSSHFPPPPNQCNTYYRVEIDVGLV